MVDNNNVKYTVDNWTNDAVNIFNGTPFVTVEITGTNSPVPEGETIEVYVDVSKTGGLPDTHEVILSEDGNNVDSINIKLTSGETKSITLKWNTDSNDTGVSKVCVSVSQSQDCTAVTVQKQVQGEIDLFDDADFSEYSKLVNETPTVDEMFSQETDFVAQGDSAARVTALGNEFAVAVSDSGLPNYPTRGDKFTAKIAAKIPEDEVNYGNSVYVYWGDTSGRYAVLVGIPPEDSPRVKIFTSQSEEKEDILNIPEYDESYVKFVVRYDVDGNGYIEADVYLNDKFLGTLSINDTNYGSGRFGVGVTRYGGYVDDVRLI